MWLHLKRTVRGLSDRLYLRRRYRSRAFAAHHDRTDARNGKNLALRIESSMQKDVRREQRQRDARSAVAPVPDGRIDRHESVKSTFGQGQRNGLLVLMPDIQRVPVLSIGTR